MPSSRPSKERKATDMPETPDLNEILQMAQNAQAELQKAQQSLDQIEVEGAAGGGLVTIRATAKWRVLVVAIDDSLVRHPIEKSPHDDLVAAAFHEPRPNAAAP